LRLKGGLSQSLQAKAISHKGSKGRKENPTKAAKAERKTEKKKKDSRQNKRRAFRECVQVKAFFFENVHR